MCSDTGFDGPRRWSSQIFGDGFELPQGHITFPAARSNCPIKAMIDVVMDQRLLGIHDCALDCLQLLSKLHAGLPFFNHTDDALQVTVSAPESLDDVGMMRV
jgi:hypothetical protein